MIHSRSPQRAHTFSRTGWSDAQPGPSMPECNASLAFSARTDVRPPQRKPRASNLGWWALCVVALAGFVLLVNAMLASSAETAGPSPTFVVAQHHEATAAPDLPEVIDAPTISTHAPAPLVYKCVGARNTVSYQSSPCGAQQSMARIYEAVPDTASDIAWSRHQQRKAAADAAALSRMAGTDGQTASWSRTSGHIDQRRAQCESAMANRDEVLERIGLARTFDLLRQLDENVRAACKGL